MYFLVIVFGFVLALRGTRPAPLQRPVEGLVRVWREAADFFLTTGLILAIGAAALTFENSRAITGEYTFFGFGLAAYLLSRYQKKTDVFFLTAALSAFMIHGRQEDLLSQLSMAWAVSAGIGIFQTGLLGLRYRLLFSNVPAFIKGWPMLCLLAGFLSIVLWSAARLVF
jgi:asparagine N-glycosylation enzyme membrane subunit Stt3